MINKSTINQTSPHHQPKLKHVQNIPRPCRIEKRKNNTNQYCSRLLDYSLPFAEADDNNELIVQAEKLSVI